jgi:hypothetical protein
MVMTVMKAMAVMQVMTTTADTPVVVLPPSRPSLSSPVSLPLAV